MRRAAGPDVRAAVVMSHDVRRDTLALRGLFANGAPPEYVGVLGPRSRTEEIRASLAADGVVVHGLRAPAGLDLGGDGAEAIALSIVAEIQAVLHGATGASLTEKKGAIHARS
jgi:xanthine/CO dehydrogenase XdhC/CoxF family maturation factor